MQILEHGFEHRTMKESLPFSPGSGSAFFGPEIIRYDFQFSAVCFTDLPIDKIKPHIDQYGKYIISLSKDWGMANGITPVRYVHHYTPDILHDKASLLRSFVENPDMSSRVIETVNQYAAQAGTRKITKDDMSHLPDNIRFLIRFYNHIINDISNFIYSHFGLMRIYEDEWEDRVTGETNNRRFYNEREWRSLDIDGKKENLIFLGRNIENIYVPTIEEKQDVLDFFKDNVDRFKISNFSEFKSKIKLTSELTS